MFGFLLNVGNTATPLSSGAGVPADAWVDGNGDAWTDDLGNYWELS